jgi:putative ubiquitin-RnfH superfamily antitoxin RatB of RatAB toxin-antitoxin module
MNTTTDETVEVVYATPEIQRVVAVPFTPGMTAMQAVLSTKLLEEFPEIKAHPLVLGIFGERVDESYELVPGNRVEICRPLQQDPRDMRWSLTATGGVMGRSRDDQGK